MRIVPGFREYQQARGSRVGGMQRFPYRQRDDPVFAAPDEERGRLVELVGVITVAVFMAHEVAHLQVAGGFAGQEEVGNDFPLQAFGGREPGRHHRFPHAVEALDGDRRHHVVHALYAHGSSQAIGHVGGEEFHRPVDDDEPAHLRPVQLVV